MMEVVDKEAFENPPLSLAKLFNPTYFSVIPEENYFVDQIRAEKSVPFSGKMKRLSPTEYEITPGAQPTGCVWEREFSDVGFIDFTISVEKRMYAGMCSIRITGASMERSGEIPTAPATIWLRAAIT